MLLFDRGSILELLEFFELASCVRLGINGRDTSSLDSVQDPWYICSDIIVVIHHLDLETFIMIWFLMSRGSMIDPKDIPLMYLNIFLLVNNIFYDVSMTQMSLIQSGLKICEKWRRLMRFLMIIKVIEACLGSTH